MPVILASLIFAISLSLLPYTESQEHESEEEMQRLKEEYVARTRKRSVKRMESNSLSERNGNGKEKSKTLYSGEICDRRIATLRPTPKRSASLPHTPYSRSARRQIITGLAKEV